MSYELTDFQTWVNEAQETAQLWRPQSWVDSMMYDGDQWNETDYQIAVDAGIDPLTINRIFPTVNLTLGLQIVNQQNIIAKGRTQQDVEISQTMTEGIQFVMDQWNGTYLIQKAYKDQIIPGVGFLYVGHSGDPRTEKIKVSYRDWKEIWVDPFADPWLDSKECRYIFHQRWIDVEELKSRYPDKSSELNDYMQSNASVSSLNGGLYYDEAQQVEDYKLIYGNRGAERKRVRPVELWYPVYEKISIAKYSDGNYLEITDKMSAGDIVQIVYNCQEIVKSTVKKMKYIIFLDNIILSQGYSPFNHDEFPFVPFIAYLDRYNFPFGVPRQLQGQQIEINKRRSMALALLKTRRVTVEKGAVDTDEDLQKLYEEANKPSGFLVVKNGKLQSIKIDENAGLAAPQMDILRDSEREIQQISGANAELHGLKQGSESGVAIQERINQSATIIASLQENLRRSLTILGNQITAGIQANWTKERILRITDRLTGADRFVELNKKVPDWRTGKLTTQNDITKGKFDMIITQTPATDTVREQNMNLLIETMKKSPPEMAPYIFATAMELSNLPNKDILMARIKPMLKINPEDETLSPEQLKEKMIAELQAQAQQAQELAQYEAMLRKVTLENAMLENEKLKAEIEKIRTGSYAGVEKVNIAKEKLKISGVKTGFDIKHQANEDIKNRLSVDNNQRNTA